MIRVRDKLHRKGETAMKNATIIKGAIIACCLIGMLVLPAAAAGQGNATIDPGLKNALWTEQGQHRLTVFDANVQHANNVIGILGQVQHRYDTASGYTCADNRRALSAPVSLRKPGQELPEDRQPAARRALEAVPRGSTGSGTRPLQGSGPGTGFIHRQCGGPGERRHWCARHLIRSGHGPSFFFN